MPVINTSNAFSPLVRRRLDADGAGAGGFTDTWWVYDGDEAILEFHSAAATAPPHRYLWGPAVDQILADEQVAMGSPADVRWPMTDWQGAVRDVATFATDVTTIANHKVYEDFGKVHSESGPTVDTIFGYTGRYFDDDRRRGALAWIAKNRYNGGQSRRVAPASGASFWTRPSGAGKVHGAAADQPPRTKFPMPLPIEELLRYRRHPSLQSGTLVLAFSGWMDGGEVSTGTVQRLVDLLKAEPIAEIDPEPFYIYNIPGPMEVASIFRPHVEVAAGLIRKIDMPVNRFYCHEPANLILFVGKEPNLHWCNFGECIFRIANETQIERILFVGSFGGAVPHTREPRLYVTCSDANLLEEMEPYGVRPSDYEGPGSFTSYLMTQAASEGLQMISLVAEIPGYLQGANPPCIAAVTRRLAKILRLSLDSDALRTVSTEWELQVSSIVEQDEELAREVRRLEEEYDYDLLKSDSEGHAT